MSEPTVTKPADPEHILQRLAAAPDEEVALADGALALAALNMEDPDIDACRDHLADLARAAARRAPANASLDERIAALNAAIVDDARYSGDTRTYDDLANANLIQVIDRRRGLPVALGIIYLDVAHRNGWEATGLNFPGHFLIRLDDGHDRAIVDPFEGGAVRGAAELRALLKLAAGAHCELSAEHYQPVDRRSVLIRLQNNIKIRQIRAGRLEAATATVEQMLIFAPRAPSLRREAGLLNARIGHLVSAARHLEVYRDFCADPAEKADVDALIHELSNQLN